MGVLGVSFMINLLCARFDCNYYRSYPTSLPVLEENDKPDPPVVFTDLGGLEGYYMKVVSGKKVYAFEGIPYAEPPVGNRRFRDPFPKAPWKGIRSAKKYGSDCPQISLTRNLNYVGLEDCLYLNIYSPQIPTETNKSPKLPVIIYIHGGNFFYGAGREYGPAYLLQEDVILVTINYRLGVLGFMSTGDEESLGNWGLKDQGLAIKWIHENIANFGGDPDKITLTGQSAGGSCVHLQMLSTTSLARDRFIHAAAFSGSAFNHWAVQTPEYAKYFTYLLAKYVGCPTKRGSKALVKCLRSLNGEMLAARQRQLQVTSIFPLMLFAPVIEPNVTGAFLTNTPDFYYKNNLVMKIPFECTNTAEEAAFLYLGLDNIMMGNYYIRHWRSLGPLLFDYGRFTHNSSGVTQRLAETYFGNEIHDNGLRMNKKGFWEMGSDRYFTYPNRLALRSHSKIAPTYSYNYHFRGKTGVATNIHTDFRKSEATHGDDMAVMFNSSLMFEPLERDTLQFKVSEFLVNLLANFAKYGEPLYSQEDGTLKKIWEPIEDPNNLKFLDIDTEGVVKMLPESPDKARKLEVWRELKLNFYN